MIRKGVRSSAHSAPEMFKSIRWVLRRELPDRADVMLARIRQDRRGAFKHIIAGFGFATLLLMSLGIAPVHPQSWPPARGPKRRGDTGEAPSKPVLSSRLAVKTRELGEFDPWRFVEKIK